MRLIRQPASHVRTAAARQSGTNSELRVAAAAATPPRNAARLVD